MSAVPAAARPAKKPPTRLDPKKVRAINGTGQWATGLKNQRADRKYVLASKSDTLMGVEYYEALGYEVELAKPGVNALKFVAGKTCREGQPLESFGHVCMSMSLADWEHMEEFGVSGDTGQNRASLLEQRMLSKRGFTRDITQGVPGIGQYLGVRNESVLEDERANGNAFDAE